MFRSRRQEPLKRTYIMRMALATKPVWPRADAGAPAGADAGAPVESEQLDGKDRAEMEEHTKMCKVLKCLKTSVTVDFFQGVLKYGSQFGTIF